MDNRIKSGARSPFASLVSVRLAGEGKDEISVDTLTGKFTVAGTENAVTPCGGLARPRFYCTGTARAEWRAPPVYFTPIP